MLKARLQKLTFNLPAHLKNHPYLDGIEQYNIDLNSFINDL